MGVDQSAILKRSEAMARYIDATHNMLYKLSPDKWQQDLAKSSRSAICGYQEAVGGPQRKVLKDHCDQMERGIYHPPGCGTPLSWARSVFEKLPEGSGVIKVHEAHPTHRFDPARDITKVALKHKKTGKRFLNYNVWPTSGAERPEPNHLPPSLNDWKDWAFAQYWLDLMADVAKQMGSERWDVITLRGDYNGSLINRSEWYYPASMLGALFRPDWKRDGLDHHQHTHGSDVVIVRRWVRECNSDHDIHFVEREIKDIKNYA